MAECQALLEEQQAPLQAISSALELYAHSLTAVDQRCSPGNTRSRGAAGTSLDIGDFFLHYGANTPLFCDPQVGRCVLTGRISCPPGSTSDASCRFLFFFCRQAEQQQRVCDMLQSEVAPRLQEQQVRTEFVLGSGFTHRLHGSSCLWFIFRIPI